MENLRKQLNEECTYRISDGTMDQFLALMTEMPELKQGEPLIPYGKCDDNIYVLKSGIVRLVYFDGAQERTFAFGMPGTLMISYYSFYMHQPTFHQMEACCDGTVAMKISKTDFLDMIRRSTDFAEWILWMSIGQLWFYEKKLMVVSGDARERFRSLIKNRPEIFEKVQQKIIASYIGVSPQYLSALKRQFSKK